RGKDHDRKPERSPPWEGDAPPPSPWSSSYPPRWCPAGRTTPPDAPRSSRHARPRNRRRRTGVPARPPLHPSCLPACRDSWGVGRSRRQRSTGEIPPDGMTSVMPRFAGYPPAVSEEVPTPGDTRMTRLRNSASFSLVSLGYLAVIPALQAALDDDLDAAAKVALIASAAAAVVQRVRFINNVLREREPPRGPTAEHMTTFAVAVATWGYGVTVQADPLWWCFLPGIVAGGVVLNTAPGRRIWTTLVLAVGTSVACPVAAQWRQSELEPRITAVLAGLSATFVVVLVLLDVAQVWFWDMVVELDRSRTMAEELAVARERLRFAADLHDIQGHHLQAIMLKGELTERLIGRDDDA